MFVEDADSVLPGVEDVLHNFIHADVVLDLGHDKSARAPHPSRVARHDFEVGADGWCQIGFIDDQQVALSEAGTAFARDFVAARHIDNLDREIG